MPLSKSLSGDFDFSQLKQNWMGEWDNSIIYKINDTVRLNGKAYVCNSNFFLENNLFGNQYKPGIDTTNWTLVINGSVYKGNWSYKDRHYIGDIVRYNEDYYQCTVDNFGGHPIYENGSATTKWVLIAESSKEDRSRNHVWFPNYPPIGWTRNMCETVEQFGSPGEQNQITIDGNYRLAFMGRIHARNGWGLGERTTWLNAANTSGSISTTWTYTRFSGFDLWDFIDNRLPTPTGKAPRIIQVSGNDEFTLVLFDNGELYHTGSGGSGESGDATTNTYQYFVRVGRSGARGTGVLRDIKIIKVGHNQCSGTINTSASTHSCFALDSLGRVWMWGWNGYGQLATGDTLDRSTPFQIPQSWFHNKRIVDMWMAGNDFPYAYALTEDGELYSWGYNADGALGTGHQRPQYRPERIKYNWARHGGIKKLLMTGANSSGSTRNNVVVVLTNNGELHATGAMAKSSHSIYGAGTQWSESNFRHNFIQLAKLYETTANSLGIGTKINQIGIMFDVMRDVDDFWLISDGASHTLIMKSKSSGQLYGVGHQGQYIMPYYSKQIGIPEYLSDDPMNRFENIMFPVILNTGNMIDIKYVHKYGTSSSMGMAYLNSDGRMWTNGYNSSYYARGIGNGFGSGQHNTGYTKLPWEHFMRDPSWVQPRFSEPISMICGVSSNGWGILTTNGRYLFAGGTFGFGTGWDPANNNSSTTFRSSFGNSNFSRTSL
jgi:hypothetical protein